MVGEKQRVRRGARHASPCTDITRSELARRQGLDAGARRGEARRGSGPPAMRARVARRRQRRSRVRWRREGRTGIDVRARAASTAPILGRRRSLHKSSWIVGFTGGSCWRRCRAAHQTTSTWERELCRRHPARGGADAGRLEARNIRTRATARWPQDQNAVVLRRVKRHDASEIREAKGDVRAAYPLAKLARATLPPPTHRGVECGVACARRQGPTHYTRIRRG